MRLRIFVGFLVCTAGLFGQRTSPKPGAKQSTNTFTNNGNVLYPGLAAGAGGVAPPGTSGIGTLVGPGGGANFAGTGAGYGRGRGRQPAALTSPYGYGFGGGLYYVGGAQGPVYSPAPGTYDPIFGVYGQGYNNDAGAYVAQYSQQGQPVVVINQNFQTDSVRPQIMDYSNAMLPPGPQASSAVGSTIDGDTPMILIALKDHTITPALAYWIQGDTLNYVIPSGAVNHASLAEVDRELSLKLNANRRADFKLP